jgi:hypothetical protein
MKTTNNTCHMPHESSKQNFQRYNSLHMITEFGNSFKYNRRGTGGHVQLSVWAQWHIKLDKTCCLSLPIIKLSFQQLACLSLNWAFNSCSLWGVTQTSTKTMKMFRVNIGFCPHLYLMLRGVNQHATPVHHKYRQLQNDYKTYINTKIYIKREREKMGWNKSYWQGHFWRTPRKCVWG